MKKLIYMIYSLSYYHYIIFHYTFYDSSSFFNIFYCVRRNFFTIFYSLQSSWRIVDACIEVEIDEKEREREIRRDRQTKRKRELN